MSTVLARAATELPDLVSFSSPHVDPRGTFGSNLFASLAVARSSTTMRHRTHDRRPNKVSPELPLLGKVLPVFLGLGFRQLSREPQSRVMARWDG